jgi:regulator of RNase E activity RraA
MTNPGFRILPLQQRADRQLIEQFRDLATPLISDNMNRIQGATVPLTPLHRSGKILGSAFTVKTRAGDNLMVHKAIDLAAPGDVIVVDAGGDLAQAIIGEIMMRLAIKNQLAGYVIDGAVRDSSAFYDADFPCFARGVSHRGPFKEGPGEINVTVSVGGMIVHPGDIIVGDRDGIVAISPELAEQTAELALAQKAREEQIFRTVEDGTIDRTWIDEVLRKKGCDFK